MGECPLCGQSTQKASTRLIKDACGHMKCRLCLLQEENGCRICKEASLEGSPHKISSIGNFNFSLPDSNTTGLPNYENPTCTPIQLDFNKIPDNYGYDCIAPAVNGNVNGTQSTIENQNKGIENTGKNASNNAEAANYLPPSHSKEVNNQLKNAQIVLTPNKPQNILLPMNETVKVQENQNIVSNVNKPSNLMLILLTPIQKNPTTNAHEVAKVVPQIQNPNCNLPNALPFGFVNNGSSNLKHSNNLLIINKNVESVNQGNVVEENRNENIICNQLNETSNQPNEGSDFRLKDYLVVRSRSERQPNEPFGSPIPYFNNKCQSERLPNESFESPTQYFEKEPNELLESMDDINPEIELSDFLLFKDKPVTPDIAQNNIEKNCTESENNGQFKSNTSEIVNKSVNNSECSKSIVQVNSNEPTVEIVNKTLDTERKFNGQEDNKLEPKLKKVTSNDENKENKQKLTETRPDIKIIKDVIVKRGRKPKPKVIEDAVGTKPKLEVIEDAVEIKSTPKVIEDTAERSYGHMVLKTKKLKTTTDNSEVQDVKNNKCKITASESESINTIGQSPSAALGRGKRIKMPKVLLYEDDTIQLKNMVKPKRTRRRNVDWSHIELLPDNSAYKCTSCGKTFKKLHSRAYHTVCRAGTQSTLCCKYCNRTFNTRSHYEYHQRVHENNRPFSCDICDKSFVQKNKLNRHMLCHKEESDVECNQCGKKFVSKEYLKLHMYNIHSKERKAYECKICGKSFNLEVNKKRHERQHLGDDRRFKCSVCSKAFSFQFLLNRHKKIHDNDKPYSCNHCSRIFLNKYEVKRHMPIHFDLKAHSCKFCDEKFSRLDNLNRHIKHHHTNGTNDGPADTDSPTSAVSSVAKNESKKNEGTKKVKPAKTKQVKGKILREQEEIEEEVLLEQKEVEERTLSQGVKQIEENTALQEEKQIEQQTSSHEEKSVEEQTSSLKQVQVEEQTSSQKQKLVEEQTSTQEQKQVEKQILSLEQNVVPVKRKRGRPRKYDEKGQLLEKVQTPKTTNPPISIMRPKRIKRSARSYSRSSSISSLSLKSVQSSPNPYQSPKYERSNAVPVIRGPIKFKCFGEELSDASSESRPSHIQPIPREAAIVLNREIEEKASCSYPGLSRLISAPSSFSNRRRNSNGNNVNSNDSANVANKQNQEKSKTGESNKESENQVEEDFDVRKDVHVHWRRRTAERLKPRLATD